MPKLYVTELSRDADLVQWDELIAHSPQGTIFQTSGWLNACARSLGKKVKIFGCFQDAQLVGGCSLFLERKYSVVPIAVSTCEMTPYGGFVLSGSRGTGVHKQESFSLRIIESIIEEVKKEHFFSVSILNSPEFLDIRPFTLNGWRSSVFYTYYINLEDNLETHADQLVKKNIRKAEKNRISIESFSDISKYYSLLHETFARKHLKPTAPKSLFTDLFSFIRYQNCGEMVVAKTPDNDIACAEIVIWDNRLAYSWSAVSDLRFLNSGATSFLRFDDLKRMKARGIPKMNMMMGNVPELSQFVAHLNPILVPYYEVQTRIFDDILRLKN
jgi:hypothetical protein